MTSLQPLATRATREIWDNFMYTIGRLAQDTGCKVQTIRYYEEIGVMPPPDRSKGNQRLYERSHMHRLLFIRHSRELGFPLDTIRQLLNLTDNPSQPCETVTRTARAHLAEVNSRIVGLQNVKLELERMISQCDGGRQMSECRIIEVLSTSDK